MPVIGGVKVPFVPAGGETQLKKKTEFPGQQEPSKFREIFDKELTKLKFSGHAQTRMNSRGINISEADLLRLDEAVSKAETKNAANPLVIMDDKAFIVNVPNKTVITVMNKDQMNEQVITQIDSAVIA